MKTRYDVIIVGSGPAGMFTALELIKIHPTLHIAIFEKGAAVYRDPVMKWAAQSILRTVTSRTDTMGVGESYSLTDAFRWSDESIVPARPTSLSQDVLDDVIGKKVVFRNGWADSSMYLLLNYCDEGKWGFPYREYLRNTISVEHEKMTHGHSDENSIVLLMNKGSVLLHDAGYRDDDREGQRHDRYAAY